VEYSCEGYTTASGIIIGVNVDAIYEHGVESHAADMTEVYGRVVRVPEILPYSKNDPNGMSWNPEMEIEVGDYVWFNIIISRNCSEIVVGDRLYKVITYEDLIAAKKGGIDGEIIPLNGNCLIEPIKEQSLSKFDILSSNKTDIHKGIARYVGKPVIEYQTPLNYDHKDVQVGDLVTFDKNYVPYYLERKKIMAEFDDDNLYFVAQRRRIAMTQREGSYEVK